MLPPRTSGEMKMNKTSVFIIMALCSVSQLMASPNNPNLQLEEPARNGKVSGISNLRGWAVDEEEIVKIEFYVDGEYYADIPYGGQRKDVGAVRPSYPNADKSGFGQTFNFGELGPGEHRINVVAYGDNNVGGTYRLGETYNYFEVVSLPKPYYPESESPNIERSYKGIYLVGYTHQSSPYVVELRTVYLNPKESVDMELEWSTAAQRFVVSKVEERPLPPWCESWMAPDSDFPRETITFEWHPNALRNGFSTRGGNMSFQVWNRSGRTVRVERVVIESRRNTIATEYYNLSLDGIVTSGSYLNGSIEAQLLQSRDVVTDFTVKVDDECFVKTINLSKEQLPL